MFFRNLITEMTFQNFILKLVQTFPSAINVPKEILSFGTRRLVC